MKKDLGKTYGNPVETSAPEKKHYPSTTLEDTGIDVPKSMIDKDIEVKMTVRICRCTDETDKKGTKSRLELEFRKIDFGGALDQDLQDEITDAIEDAQGSEDDEAAEDKMVE